MAIDQVRAYLSQWGLDSRVREFTVSSATVELAAAALGVEGARIAKTLSFAGPEGCILIVTAGDTKVSNALYKAEFGCKAKMLTAAEALDYTGHAVGGVCPFAIERSDVSIYLDTSLKRFDTVFPAAGSDSSAVEMTPNELEQASRCKSWVSICVPR